MADRKSDIGPLDMRPKQRPRGGIGTKHAPIPHDQQRIVDRTQEIDGSGKRRLFRLHGRCPGWFRGRLAWPDERGRDHARQQGGERGERRSAGEQREREAERGDGDSAKRPHDPPPPHEAVP
jgi:hypothetical protein